MSENTTVVEKSKNRSIHPRVVNGATAYPKVNTSKKKSQATIQRAIAGIERHLNEHPRDAMSQQRHKKLQEML